MSERGRGAIRSETARIAILRATASQLSERGWDQLTIESIATSAGVGKPTIYRWWSSKSALIADALLEGLLAPPGPLPTDTGDLRRDLLAWLEPTLRITAAEESTSLSRSLIAAAAEDAVVGDRLDAANPAYHALSTRLSAAKARGELDDDTDIDVVVDALVGAVVMRMLRRASYREGEAAALIDAVIPRS